MLAAGKFDYADSIGERLSGTSGWCRPALCWGPLVASPMNRTADTSPASPACLAHEADDAYMGFATPGGDHRLPDGPGGCGANRRTVRRHAAPHVAKGAGRRAPSRAQGQARGTINAGINALSRCEKFFEAGRQLFRRIDRC